MSRPTYDVKDTYTGDGSLAVYTFDFKITALDQLEVVEYNASGVETQRVRGTDTTYLSPTIPVAFDAVDGAGTVTLAVNLINGYTLVLLLADDSPAQTYEFRNKGDFTLKLIENAIDRIAGAVQRAAYRGKQALRLNDNDDEETFDTKLPTAVASKLLGINATNDGLALYTPTEAGVTTGDVTGPVSSTDNGLARMDGTTGKIVQSSTTTLSDAGALVVATSVKIGASQTVNEILDDETQIDYSDTALITQASMLTFVNGYRIHDFVSLNTTSHSPYTPPASTILIECDTNSADMVVNLANIAGLFLGKKYIIAKKDAASIYKIVVNCDASDTFNVGGISTTVINIRNPGDRLEIIGAGSNTWEGNLISEFNKPRTIVTKTTTYQILNHDDFIAHDSSGGAFDITLPLAASVAAGKQFTIQSGHTNAVNLLKSGSDTYLGYSTASFNAAYEQVTVMSNGVSAWFITNELGTVMA
jgi:hypothetical protein